MVSLGLGDLDGRNVAVAVCMKAWRGGDSSAPCTECPDTNSLHLHSISSGCTFFSFLMTAHRLPSTTRGIISLLLPLA